jgi:type IV pilus assembly protein PilA
MLKKIREMKEEDGFTLIELMVVVLIIAILIAIALPTFLGLRQRAQDRAAQSNLRNGMAAAKAYYTDNETFVGYTVAVAEGIEPSLLWDSNGTVGTPTGDVEISLVSATDVVLEADSASGQNFCIADSSTVGTVYGVGAAATFAACQALPDW